MRRVPFLAGNWKMHKGPKETKEFIVELFAAIAKDTSLKGFLKENKVELGIFPPFVSLETAGREIASADISLSLGAQNMHWEDSGAFTGEIAGKMLMEVGCKYVILGHSERRHIFGESDETIGKKMNKALEIGLKPVLCVGETLEERDEGITETVVKRQLEEALRSLREHENIKDNIVIAYEPVWAIGTGRKANDEDAQSVCAYIRKFIEERFGSTAAEGIRILYGGSVKPDNAKGLMEQKDIDGALIGGASLDVGSFLEISRNTIEALQ